MNPARSISKAEWHEGIGDMQDENETLSYRSVARPARQAQHLQHAHHK
jgi:hypothetical protein